MPPRLVGDVVMVVTFLLSLLLQDVPEVRYIVRPCPSDDRTDLEVELQCIGSESGQTVLELPHDSLGARGLERWVSELELDPPATLAAGTRPWLRTAHHAPGASLTLRYWVSWDPATPPESTYRPHISADHLHAFYGQWMVRPQDSARTTEWFVEGLDVPDDWAFFGSHGFDDAPGSVTGAFADIEDAVLATGAYRHRLINEESSLHLFILGAYAASDEQLAGSLRRIAAQQRTLFAGDAPSRLVVSLTPVPERAVAGISVPAALPCMIHPERETADVLVLLAHEMFHQWLPRRGRVTGAYPQEFQWIDEGFTEYFARRMTFDLGLLPIEHFVALTNRDLRELRNNPQRHITANALRSAHVDGPRTNDHYRLAYTRGALIALTWDHALRSRGEGLETTLCDVVRHGSEGMDAERFVQLLTHRGLDASGDIARWIERGEAIVPPPSAHGPTWRWDGAQEQFVPAPPSPSSDR